MVTRFPTTVATLFTNNDKSIDYDTAWWFRCITPKATRALVAIIINIFAFVIAAVALYDTTYYISKRWELEQRISVIDRRKEELWFPTAGGGRGWGYRTKLTTKTPSTLEKAASGILQQYLPPCLSIHTILRTVQYSRRYHACELASMDIAFATNDDLWSISSYLLNT